MGSVCVLDCVGLFVRKMPILEPPGIYRELAGVVRGEMGTRSREQVLSDIHADLLEQRQKMDEIDVDAASGLGPLGKRLARGGVCALRVALPLVLLALPSAYVVQMISRLSGNAWWMWFALMGVGLAGVVGAFVYGFVTRWPAADKACPECEHDLSNCSNAVPPAELGGSHIGPVACPECGLAWPLVERGSGLIV